MTHKINKRTRIKLQFYIPAVDVVFCLQIKVWYGWKTVNWIYPSSMKNSNIKEVIKYLKYDFYVESINTNEESEFEIGKKILENN